MQLVQQIWHNDRHRMSLVLNKSDLSITTVTCPHGPDSGAACHHPTAGCIVRWFLERFGLDCHVGVAEPTPEVQLAWTWAGDHHDLDLAQIWVVSVEDEIWKAWSSAQYDPSGD
jgi:hypothetical protein